MASSPSPACNPGTWSVIETQPGFFVDGKDTHGGVVSPTNDRFSGISLAPSQTVGDFNFGEQGVRAEFVSAFLDRRAFFASTIVNGGFSATVNPTGPVSLLGGDVWVSFDGGFTGTRTIQATYPSGTATMTLYNNSMQVVAISTAANGVSTLTYTGVSGAPYFLKVTGTATNVTFSVSGGTTYSSLPNSPSVASPSVATPSVATSRRARRTSPRRSSRRQQLRPRRRPRPATWHLPTTRIGCTKPRCSRAVRSGRMLLRGGAILSFGFGAARPATRQCDCVVRPRRR